MAFIGVVYKQGYEDAVLHRVVDECDIREPFSGKSILVAGPRSEIICLVRGPDKQVVTNAVERVVEVEKVFDDNSFFSAPPVSAGTGVHFIYLYFKQCYVAWNYVSYVGKGKGRRDQGHVAAALKLRRKTGHPVTYKERDIEDGLCLLDRICPNGAPLETPQAFANAATVGRKKGLELFRRAFVGLSDFEAFCVEYHLITSKYGAFNVSNNTNGNSNGQAGQYRIMSRPRAFNVNVREHCEWWDEACQDFVKKGGLSYLSKARLDLMPLEPLVNEFDKLILPGGPLHGLIRPAIRPKNKYGPSDSHLKHLWAAHGQDPTINYDVVGCLDADDLVQHVPFRIELVARRAEAAVRINLRPATGINRTQFETHVDALVKKRLYAANPISIPGSAETFFKPFAPDGIGWRDVDFEFSQRNGVYRETPGHGLCWPNWHPDRHGPPPRTFNVETAIHAILKHLLP